MLDMERKFASAGPNKQMYEMYNTGFRNANDPTLGMGIPGSNFATSEGVGTAPPQPYFDQNRQGPLADGNSEGDLSKTGEGAQVDRPQEEGGQGQIDGTENDGGNS